MGHQNGVISAPVNTDDVGAVIGSSSHDVATLCIHENVKKWSKHKPVRGESPGDYATWDAATGRVRSVTGFPIIWGMTPPFNTTQQLSTTGSTVATTALLKPLALRVSKMLDASKCVNAKNYEYVKPVVGTDYCRLGDFVGYRQNAPEAWTCGVSGATMPSDSSNSVLTVDAFDTAEIGFYIGMPSDADISFKDLFSSDGYRFIVELYTNDASFPTDTTAPKVRLVSMQKLSAMTYGQNFSVPVSRLKGQNGLIWSGTTGTSDDEKTLYAILGVVRFSSEPTLTEEKRANATGMGCAVLSASDASKIVAGEGSVPPWTQGSNPFVCKIKIQAYSKLFLQALGHYRPANMAKPTADSNYTAFPTSASAAGPDGFYLKFSVTNKGTSAVTVGGGYSGSGTYPPKFQIQAWGAYDTSAPSYSANCLSAAEGRWHDVEICSDAKCSTPASAKVIQPNASATFYADCSGILPSGRTSRFNFRVSTDNGQTWYITGAFSGAFLVS